jgi:hypothetical protein
VSIGAWLLAIAAFLFGWKIGVAALLVALAIYLAANWWERRRRRIELYYELPGQAAQASLDLIGAFNHLAGCETVEVLRGSLERSELAVRTSVAKIGEGQPPWVVTNVAVPQFAWEDRAIYFLPDGVLYYDKSGAAQFEYSALQLSAGTTEVPQDHVPRDGKQVSVTWKHIKQDGTADRRFKDNPERPICEFGTLGIHVDTGLKVLLTTSNPAAPAAFVAAMQPLCTASPELAEQLQPVIGMPG